MADPKQLEEYRLGVENISNAENVMGVEYVSNAENVMIGNVTESVEKNEGIQENNAEPTDNGEPTSVEFDKEMFIEEVRKYRCLWDVNSEAYKNRLIKQNAWANIGTVFNKDGEFCVISYMRIIFCFKVKVFNCSLTSNE